MNKLFFLLALLAVITIFIAIFNPQLHKPLIISEGRYGVKTSEIAPPVNETKTIIANQNPIKTENPVIVKNENTVTPAKTIKTSTKENNSNTKTKTVNVNNTKKTPVKVNQMPAKTVNKTVVPQQSTKKVQEKPAAVKTEPKKEVKTEPPKQEVKPPVQTSAVNTQKVQQEEISWNVWRSKLANQIISEIRMPAVPEGTIFEFSFNVNNQGVITNVRTKSSSPQYTAYAIQYIAPVIRSFQGRSILKFPSGTERTSILFESKWRVINGNVQYSTPANYHDIEIIRK